MSGHPPPRSDSATVRPLIVAVPNLERYKANTGIGRVLTSLRAAWGERVQLVSATLDAIGAPLLRNIPLRVRAKDAVDVILLPQLTGALALRDTEGVPSVAIVHDIGVVDFPGDRKSLDRVTYHTIKANLHGLTSAREVIAISQFTRDRLIKHLPQLSGCVTVIPCGVSMGISEPSKDEAIARQRLAERFALPPGSPLVLNVGSELPRKNMALLMAAFAGVRSVFPAAMLLKVGAAGHSRWRETTLDAARQCGLHLNEHVLLLDSDVDDEFLADIYRASDVFVSTSLYEGFGLPALEAMAVGTPVVVTQCGALPETVGDAGWVVYPEAHHVTDAICEALTNARLRDQRVAAGRRRAASLTWDAAGDAYLEVLRACAARWVRGGTQVGVNA